MVTRHKGKLFLFEWREALLSEHGPSDPNLQHILLVLSQFADIDGGNCYPSQRTLSNKCRRSLNTINKKLQNAKKLGWVTARKVGFGGQGWKHAEYQLSIPRDVKRKQSEGSIKGVPVGVTPLCEGLENGDLTPHSPGKCNSIDSLQEGVPPIGTRKGVPVGVTPLCEGQENGDLTQHSPGKCNSIVSLREGVPPGGKKVFPRRCTTKPIDLPNKEAFSNKSEKAPADGRRPSIQKQKSDIENQVGKHFQKSEKAHINKKPFDNEKPASHFSAKTGDHVTAITAACQKISTLKKKNRAFNPFQWVQFWTNKSAHPGAIQESLQGLIAYWDEIDIPWSYADKIMRTKNGNYNERDAIAESAKFKAVWVIPDDMRALIGGVGHHIPDGPARMANHGG